MVGYSGCCNAMYAVTVSVAREARGPEAALGRLATQGPQLELELAAPDRYDQPGQCQVD